MSSHDKEGILKELEEYYAGSMPPDCLQAFKRFSLCKASHNEEIIKSKGSEFFNQYLTQPFSKIDGCKTEYSSYESCYAQFYNKYVDLKNFVAQIEGNHLPFDKKAMKKELVLNDTKYDFGLNKL